MEALKLDQQSSEWEKWRLKGLGSSEAAAIMGVSKWLTPLMVWEDKTGRSKHDATNWATVRGQELEPKVRAWYEIMNDASMPPALVQNPVHEFVIASLDGYNREAKRILEIKYQGKEDHEKTGLGIVPFHYIPQVQHQLMAAQAEMNDFVSHNPDLGTTYMISILPDLEYQKALLEAEMRFWDLVKRDVAPPLTNRDFLCLTDSTSIEMFEKWKKAKLANSKREMTELKKLIEAKLTHPKVRCAGVTVFETKRGDASSFTFKLDKE